MTLRYVDGDHKDPATFHAIRSELASAQRPVHYLAIPPGLFGLVVNPLAMNPRALAEGSGRAVRGGQGEGFS